MQLGRRADGTLDERRRGGRLDEVASTRAVTFQAVLECQHAATTCCTGLPAPAQTASGARPCGSLQARERPWLAPSVC